MFPVQCMRFFFIMTNSVKHGLLFYKYLTGLSSRTLDASPLSIFYKTVFQKIIGGSSKSILEIITICIVFVIYKI